MKRVREDGQNARGSSKIHKRDGDAAAPAVFAWPASTAAVAKHRKARDDGLRKMVIRGDGIAITPFNSDVGQVLCALRDAHVLECAGTGAYATAVFVSSAKRSVALLPNDLDTNSIEDPLPPYDARRVQEEGVPRAVRMRPAVVPTTCVRDQAIGPCDWRELQNLESTVAFGNLNSEFLRMLPMSFVIMHGLHGIFQRDSEDEKFVEPDLTSSAECAFESVIHTCGVFTPSAFVVTDAGSLIVPVGHAFPFTLADVECMHADAAQCVVASLLGAVTDASRIGVMLPDMKETNVGIHLLNGRVPVAVLIDACVPSCAVFDNTCAAQLSTTRDTDVTQTSDTRYTRAALVLMLQRLFCTRSLEGDYAELGCRFSTSNDPRDAARCAWQQFSYANLFRPLRQWRGGKHFDEVTHIPPYAVASETIIGEGMALPFAQFLADLAYQERGVLVDSAEPVRGSAYVRACFEVLAKYARDDCDEPPPGLAISLRQAKVDVQKVTVGLSSPALLDTCCVVDTTVATRLDFPALQTKHFGNLVLHRLMLDLSNTLFLPLRRVVILQWLVKARATHGDGHTAATELKACLSQQDHMERRPIGISFVMLVLAARALARMVSAEVVAAMPAPRHRGLPFFCSTLIVNLVVLMLTGSGLGMSVAAAEIAKLMRFGASSLDISATTHAEWRAVDVRAALFDNTEDCTRMLALACASIASEFKNSVRMYKALCARTRPLATRGGARAVAKAYLAEEVLCGGVAGSNVDALWTNVGEHMFVNDRCMNDELE